jgi:translocation and assembly module TamA
VLAAHGRFGGIYGDVPATERFFSGGSISQRGFAERRLSPSRPDSEMRRIPYGGAGLLETSLEARVPITTFRDMPLGAAIFLDGGDVTETPGELSLKHLHWAVGAGLRLMTIVGPVRLDVGYRLNRKTAMDPEPDSAFAYHLTIGEAF